MASNGTQVFVLGGESLAGTQADETALIHVLDTSMWIFIFWLTTPCLQQSALRCRAIRHLLSIIIVVHHRQSPIDILLCRVLLYFARYM
jgi:hypothetical protein